MDEESVFGRIVFEVGILNEDDVTGGGQQTGLDSSSFSAIGSLMHDRDGRMFTGQSIEFTVTAIRAPIIDGDQFDGERLFKHAGHDVAQRLSFVIDGHHHRETKTGWNCEDSQPLTDVIAQQLREPPTIGFAVAISADFIIFVK